MSDATRATIAKLIQIDPDHPAFIYVCSALFRAKHRDGLDLDDPKVRQAAIAKGKRAYERTAGARDAAERDNWIYYVRVGDLIKIGTAENVVTRLNAYPPTAELLAVESGSYRREAERLDQFREYLAARNEWFHPGPKLMRHIAKIHDQAVLDRLLARRRRKTTA
jgi:hypothetical protein